MDSKVVKIVQWMQAVQPTPEPLQKVQGSARKTALAVGRPNGARADDQSSVDCALPFLKILAALGSCFDLWMPPDIRR